ncbi:MAG: SDR family NAD(P)-dependent oxidoreductase, partial [Pseudomonadota bacterium]
LAAEIGGKADILVNTAEHVRPGGVLDRRDVTSARDEMETACFGLLRLMQNFGPAMRARGADGENSAVAWVNIFSVFALCNMPGFGLTNASQAAGLSLAQSLRAELRGSGVKVVNGFIGPLEEDWRQPLPPPKVSGDAVARATLSALKEGVEQFCVGAVAEDIYARWRRDPAALERELLGEEM